MQNDKVTIEMPSKPEKAPIKIKKVKNQRPVYSNYKLVPRACPYLNEFIHSIQWNCVKKYLKMEIYETPGFESFDWLSTINDRKKESQKSPFTDLEQDAVVLTSFDESNNPVAQFRFFDLKLHSHSCKFQRGETSKCCSDGGFLSHLVKISYERIHQIKLEESPINEKVIDKILDYEWQSIEEPENL